MKRQRPPICRVFTFMEIWKVVEGFEDYEISNLGRVKSLKFGRELILKTTKNKRGYIVVKLSNKDKSKIFRVHQLVAIAFLGHKPCGMKLVVDHINDITYDNRVENLQIVSQRENVFKTQGKYTSQYKGVHFYHYNNKWLANIRVNQRLFYLGFFETEIEASNAYQNAVESLKNGNEFTIEKTIKKREGTSKYKGVCWHKKQNKWMSRILINKKRIFLGYFETAEQANEAYQKKLVEIQ